MFLTVHIKHVKVLSVFHFKLSSKGINFLQKLGSQVCEKYVLVATPIVHDLGCGFCFVDGECDKIFL